MEAIPNRFKYTGQQFDPVTQQYYLRARFYNPVLAPEQRNAFILDAVQGNAVENLSYTRKGGLADTLKIDPNFKGLQAAMIMGILLLEVVA